MKLVTSSGFHDDFFEFVYSDKCRLEEYTVLREENTLWLAGDLGRMVCVDLLSGTRLWDEIVWAIPKRDYFAPPDERSSQSEDQQLRLIGIYEDCVYALADSQLLAINKADGSCATICGPDLRYLMILGRDESGFICGNTFWFWRDNDKRPIEVWRFEYQTRSFVCLHRHSQFPVGIRNLGVYDENHWYYCSKGKLLLWNPKTDEHSLLLSQIKEPGDIYDCLSCLSLPDRKFMYLGELEERCGPKLFYSRSSGQSNPSIFARLAVSPEALAAEQKFAATSVPMEDGSFLFFTNDNRFRLYGHEMPAFFHGTSILPQVFTWSGQMLIFWGEYIGNHAFNHLCIGRIDEVNGRTELLGRYALSSVRGWPSSPKIIFLDDICILADSNRKFFVLRMKELAAIAHHSAPMQKYIPTPLPKEVGNICAIWPGLDKTASVVSPLRWNRNIIDLSCPRERLLPKSGYQISRESRDGDNAPFAGDMSTWQLHDLLTDILWLYATGATHNCLASRVHQLFRYIAVRNEVQEDDLLMPYFPDGYHDILTLLWLILNFVPSTFSNATTKDRQMIRPCNGPYQSPQDVAVDLVFHLVSKRPQDGSDALLHALFARLGRPDMPGKGLPLQHVGYEPLLASLSGDLSQRDKTSILQDYLRDWYKSKELCSWYGEIDSAPDPYFGPYRGYWAFDVALVARIEKLDEKQFKGSPFYPVD